MRDNSVTREPRRGGVGEPSDSSTDGLNRLLNVRRGQLSARPARPKTLTGQTVENHDQALGIHDSLPHALQDFAEALAGRCGEPAFRTLNRAVQFITRILEPTSRRGLSSHADADAHYQRMSDAGPGCARIRRQRGRPGGEPKVSRARPRGGTRKLQTQQELREERTDRGRTRRAMRDRPDYGRLGEQVTVFSTDASNGGVSPSPVEARVLVPFERQDPGDRPRAIMDIGADPARGPAVGHHAPILCMRRR